MVRQTTNQASLWITGIGTQYPEHLLESEFMEVLAERFYDIENAGIQRLLKLNRATGIETRSSITSSDESYFKNDHSPTIADMDACFRTSGVDLTVQACNQAIRDWGGRTSDITHTVAVTCTNQGSPGYDFLVNEKLNLQAIVDRTLLSGVGCAGGLSIMRVAAQLACGATMRGRPARILCYTCELCTPNVRSELEMAARSEDPAQVGIAAALFSDAAAAFVMCNTWGMQDCVEPVLELLSWDCALIPGTLDLLSYRAEPQGYRTVLSKEVQAYAIAAVRPMFDSLKHSTSRQLGLDIIDSSDFDWALHPGGQRIIAGVKKNMHLTEEQLSTTQEIYRTRGNSSSATVLAIMDKLCSLRMNRELLVATSFGPGLTIEMSMFRYCRGTDKSSEHS